MLHCFPQIVNKLHWLPIDLLHLHCGRLVQLANDVDDGWKCAQRASVNIFRYLETATFSVVRRKIFSGLWTSSLFLFFSSRRNLSSLCDIPLANNNVNHALNKIHAKSRKKILFCCRRAWNIWLAWVIMFSLRSFELITGCAHKMLGVI